jgi:hypothetical protein
MNLRAEGKRNAAKLKGEALDTIPRTARRIREVGHKISFLLSYNPGEA